jgi:DNA-binding MarR family transcriptional regulator
MAASVERDQLATALLVSLGLLFRRIRQTPVQGELTLPEVAALARLDRGGPMTTAQLARLEQISPQSVGATVAGLEERGLVQRFPDPDDGRRVILSVSEAGADVLRSKRDARGQQFARALASEFSAAEREQLSALVPLIERLAQSL